MALEISSPQNPRIKDVIRLRDRRGRQKQRRFIIDGLRELQRACNSSLEISEVYYDAAACQQQPEQELLARLEAGPTELVAVSSRVMERLSYGQRRLTMIAVAKSPALQNLSELELNTHAFVIILEAVEKPGNLGAILRTADASGVAAIILSASTEDIFNPNAIRSSCGAIFHIPIIHTSHDDLEGWLERHQFTTYATRVNGAMNYTEANYTNRSAVVLGAEATGLSANWHPQNSQAISIPMLGIGDSLNVSTSCAVICYEALRQRLQQAATDIC